MAKHPIELWGGVECTVNRVHDRYFSQLKQSGHCRRADDFERFAALGFRALRFPVIWEELAPDHPDQIEWSWIDRALGQLRELGIRPIAGLVHHGSGPRYTSLTDPDFPRKLADFATRVAQRYSWLDAYTPINEPLTTARFSGLYGHWYPHARNDRTFLEILLNEIRGVRAAMAAVRAVNPSAQLVQTEDFGRTYSTPVLRYQAQFENTRRWLTWDLLGGFVGRSHPLWSYFQRAAIPEADLLSLEDSPCPPDILGLNYYVTSERFLDDNFSAYPNELQGGNGRHRYADDAAVRAHQISIGGAGSVLTEVGQRYATPLALTEVHLGSTVDEQIRWFMEAWEAAHAVRSRGVDMRAVTSWALLGSFDWDSLVTRQSGHYEPGAFDISSGTMQATPLTRMLQSLRDTGTFEHPALQTSGWWRQRTRLREFLASDLAA